MDRMWWHEYGAQVGGDFELWTSNREAARIYDLNFISSESGGGVSDLPGVIRLGGNSGFQALGLALLFGAARVILLGYDMQYSGGKSHWHGDHKTLTNPEWKNLKSWQQHFALLASQIDVPIINATRETALQCFPRENLIDCLA